MSNTTHPAAICLCDECGIRHHDAIPTCAYVCTEPHAVEAEDPRQVAYEERAMEGAWV